MDGPDFRLSFLAFSRAFQQREEPLRVFLATREMGQRLARRSGNFAQECFFAKSVFANLGFAGRLLRGTRKTRHRSEEHTSELQSQSNLVCRLLLEKKKNIRHTCPTIYCT